MLSRCVLIAVAVSALASAGAEEPVRVYTNADLERLEPLPTSPAPSGGAAEPGWDFVIDFLAEQRARIDAQRAHELERAVVEERIRRPERPSFGRLLLLPYPAGLLAPGRGDACRSAAPAPFRPGGPRDWIAPLHAGPTFAARHRARAIERAKIRD